MRLQSHTFSLRIPKFLLNQDVRTFNKVVVFVVSSSLIHSAVYLGLSKCCSTSHVIEQVYLKDY